MAFLPNPTSDRFQRPTFGSGYSSRKPKSSRSDPPVHTQIGGNIATWQQPPGAQQPAWQFTAPPVSAEQQQTQRAERESLRAGTRGAEVQSQYSYAPTIQYAGGGGLTQRAFEELTMQRENAAARAAEQQRSLAAQAATRPRRLNIDKILSKYAPLPPQVTGSMGTGEEEARAAAFGRTRDIAAQQALAGLQAVGDISAERGMMGSTFEGQMLGDVIGGARGTIADATREQLLQDLVRSGQIADRDLAAGITQRGQDLARQQAVLSLIGQLY